MLPFRLTLTTLVARKSWFLVIFTAILLPLTLPYLTTWESDFSLLEPARAQVAWQVAWVVAIFWTFTQAARLGEANSRTGLGAYFSSRGISRVRQMFEIWLACILFILPVVAIAVAVCLIAAMPADPVEGRIWIITNLQYAVLFLMTVAPLALLGVSLGSRFGALVGYLLPVALCLYGLYGVGYLGMMVNLRENPFLEWIYAISPHYHFADLTPRLVFKLGQLPGDVFGWVLLYFTGLTLVLTALAGSVFRTDPLRA